MVSEAQRKSVDKYDKKTYKLLGLRFRFDEDAEMIEAFEVANDNGVPYRMVVSEWYEAYKKHHLADLYELRDSLTQKKPTTYKGVVWDENGTQEDWNKLMDMIMQDIVICEMDEEN